MCIIVVKPIGVDMPDKETIRECWYSNSHGAGYMLPLEGKVFIRKGFMALTHLLDELEAVGERLDLKNLPVVMHFRIGTHGGLVAENTHPFPVVVDPLQMKHLTTTCMVGAVHNGIIDIAVPTGVSDTAYYIYSQLSLLRKMDRRFYANPHAIRMIENATDSKWAFMDGDGMVTTVGKFISDSGLMFSNSTYLPSAFSRESSPYYTTVMQKLMWLDSDKCYLKIHGQLVDAVEQYMMDWSGKIYTYDAYTDTCYPIPSGMAYTHAGLALKYDYDSPDLETVPVETWKTTNPSTTKALPAKTTASTSTII